MNMKNIVVASNPFGFGPTGNAIPILKELQKRFSLKKDITVYFVGSEKCQRIVPELDSVNKILLNERDVSVIENFLKNLKGKTVVLGVQNRFIVEAGKNVGCATFFLDVLAWMWTNIPESHLAADEVFWMRFPGIVKRKAEYTNKANINIIEGIFENITRDKKIMPGSKILCLGGGFNPLRSGIQKNYLLLIASILQLSTICNENTEIVAGKEAVLFLKKQIASKRLGVSALSHDEVLDKMKVIDHYISIGGQTSTMEALLSNIPTSFFIPSNLSQLELQRIFSKEIGGNIMWWEKELEISKEKYKFMSEKEFIDLLEYVYEKTLKNKKKIKKLAKLFDDNVNNLDNQERLFKLGLWVGSGGSLEIVNKIEFYL